MHFSIEHVSHNSLVPCSTHGEAYQNSQYRSKPRRVTAGAFLCCRTIAALRFIEDETR